MKYAVTLAILVCAAGLGMGQERPKKDDKQVVTLPEHAQKAVKPGGTNSERPKKVERPAVSILDYLDTGIPTKTWPKNGKIKADADWEESRDTFERYTRGRYVRVSVQAAGIIRFRDDKGKVLSIQMGPAELNFDPSGKRPGVFRGHKYKVVCNQQQVSLAFPPDCEQELRNIQPGDTLTIAVPLSQATIEGNQGNFIVNVMLRPGPNAPSIDAKLISVD